MNGLHDYRAAAARGVPGSPHRERRRVGVAVHLARREPLLLDVAELLEAPAELPGRDEARRCVDCGRAAQRGRFHRHGSLLAREDAVEAKPSYSSLHLHQGVEAVHCHPRRAQRDKHCPDGCARVPPDRSSQEPALSTGGWSIMAKRNLVALVAAIVSVSWVSLGIPASAASGSTPGVTATTIRVGVPYVDVAAVKAVGVNISWGSVPNAFNAVIADINAHGGINGRKIVPYLVAVNPTGTAPAATACTQLIEDDNIFAAVAPLQATCYLQHDTPVVASVYASGPSSTTAQDFTTTPPNDAYDALSLGVYKKQGVFTHKKVALFGGDTADRSEE